MALTPQERDWLRALLDKEARADEGAAAMAEVLDAMNDKANNSLPPSWRYRQEQAEKEGDEE